MRMGSLYNVSERISQLHSNVGDVLLATEAGKLAGVPNEDAGKLLMLEDGQSGGDQTGGGDRSFFWSGGMQIRAPLPLPSAGMMTILRPALRAMHARLHALRSECKAAQAEYDGNFYQGNEQQP